MKSRVLKKGTAAILAAILAVAALSGCSNGEKTAGTTTGAAEQSTAQAKTDNAEIKLSMTWWGNQVRNEGTQAALNLYHEENPDIFVEGLFFQWDDYWSKLATSVAGKKMPDIVQMDVGYLNQYISSDQLLDLNPYIESGALDVSNLSDSVLNMVKVDDAYYGIAAGINSPAMFYNKTLLDENGITLKDNMSVEEFIEVAKEVYEKTGYRANLISRTWYMETWARANDAQILEKKMGADSAEDYLSYFETYERGIKDGWHITPEVADDTGAIEQDPLVYGASAETRTWCTMNGSNTLAAYQNAAEDGVEIGITTIPSDNPTKSKYLKPSMIYSVSADTPHPDEAVAVINFLINSEAANDILKGERGVPASSVIAERLTTYLGGTSHYITDIVSPDCSPIDPPAPSESNEIMDLLVKVNEKIGYGEYTAEQAAQEYFEKGTEIFNR